MKAHPIIDYPYRWIPILLLLLVLVAAQVALVCLYTGADYLPALVDGIANDGLVSCLSLSGMVCCRVRFVIADRYYHDSGRKSAFGWQVVLWFVIVWYG